MINFFKTKKLRKRCRLIAIEWIKDLAGATEEQAVKYVDDSSYFDDNLWFDVDKPDEYNTDLAILRTLDHQTSLEVECVSEGLQIYNDLPHGVIGIRSLDNLNELRITFVLGSTYVAHLMTKIDNPVPNGFLSSTILNKEINLLEFISNFYKWKELPVVTADAQKLPVESYFVRDK